MGRALRVWEPNGIYHLTPVGNDGRALFRDDVDRFEFLGRATVVLEAYEVTVLGYCLMTNHAHLLVRCGEPGLSRAMQVLFGRYSWWWNRRHGREGHLQQNRCHVTYAETEAHVKVAAAYIDLNPVRAEIVERPEEWPWSSYRAHVALGFPIPLLANDEFQRMFGRSPRRAANAYREFVREWERHDALLAAQQAA